MIVQGPKIDLPLHLPLDLLPGWIIAPAPPEELDGQDLDTLLDRLLIWEPPRPKQLYVLAADVSEGLGLDRCAASVIRVGTPYEPDEQVAQFVSSKIDPTEEFAKVLDLMGRFYTGSDGLSATLVIELNGPGYATQSELARHIGYDNLWVWEFEDAADPSRRKSTRMGWVSTQRTRAYAITRFIKRVKTVDPQTGVPDYVINSPHTEAELRDFMTPTGALVDAQADPDSDAHDDCIMSEAIGLWVVGTIQESTMENAADTRRRKSEERARLQAEEERRGSHMDYRNMDYTVEEMGYGMLDPNRDLGGGEQ